MSERYLLFRDMKYMENFLPFLFLDSCVAEARRKARPFNLALDAGGLTGEVTGTIAVASGDW